MQVAPMRTSRLWAPVNPMRRAARLASPVVVLQMKQAMAEPVVDPEDRHRLMTAPETQWCCYEVDSDEDLVAGSPVVEVFFERFASEES